MPTETTRDATTTPGGDGALESAAAAGEPPLEAGADDARAPDAPSATILLDLAYDGRLFSGWARQANARTVAGELLGAIRALDPRVADVRGASRTDAGVHAHGQIAAFDTTRTTIAPRGFVLGLARHLPKEISVRAAARAPHGCDPKREARGKRYRYLVLRDGLRDPFWEGRAWRIGAPLDLDRARREAAAILGEHDFAAFRSASDPRTSTVRTLHRVDVGSSARDPRLVAIEVEGSAFLHNMVRIIVGTLVDVALGRLAEGATARALASRERRDLGTTAPAGGLYLDEVFHAIPREDAWPTSEARAPRVG